MANRNSVTRRLPGNELGSILRETAREARRSTRDPNAVPLATEAELEALQAQVLALQEADVTSQAQILALQKRLVATVLVTPGGGVGTWVYPTPYVNVPVLVATPISATNVFTTIIGPTNVQTQFAVWTTGGAGVAGVSVNLMAFSRD